MNYLDVLKTIYTKRKLEEFNDIGMCISMTKTLSKDINNLKVLKKITPYLFYIPPKHYFYLLYFLIPEKSYVPRTIKVEKEKKKESVLLDKIQKILGWSNREMKLNEEVLEHINNDKKEWKKELVV